MTGVKLYEQCAREIERANPSDIAEIFNIDVWDIAMNDLNEMTEKSVRNILTELKAINKKK